MCKSKAPFDRMHVGIVHDLWGAMHTECDLWKIYEAIWKWVLGNVCRFVAALLSPVFRQHPFEVDETQSLRGRVHIL